MISLEDIYDLDTTTLEEKIFELQQSMMVSSPRHKKKLQKIIELAKLEVDERQAHQLSQIFQEKLKKFDFLYLNKQLNINKQPQPRLSLKINPSSFLKTKKSEQKQVTNKKFTIPKLEEVLRYKPVKQKSSLPSLKKFSSTQSNSKSLKIQQSNNIRKKTLSIANNRSKAPSILVKQRSTVALTTVNSKQLIKEIDTVQVQKPISKNKVHNKMQYVQNEHSISSEDGQENKQQQIFQPQLIIMSTQQSVELNSNLNINQFEKIFPKQQTNTQASQQLKLQQQIVQVVTTEQSVKSEKQQVRVYQDTIDYFRFTVIKRKNYQQQIQKQSNHQIIVDNKDSNIQISQSKFQQIEIEDDNQKQTLIKQDQQKEVGYKTERVMIQQQKIVCQLPNRPTTQHFKRRIKPIVKNTTKLVIQLPIPTITYDHIIPTFNHLFYPGADVFSVMRILIGALGQHLKSQSSQPTSQFQLNYQSRQYLIQKFGHLVNIQLTRRPIYYYEEKKQQNKQSCLYYRVVKTKQQVYDIITNTLHKSNWVELPHGLNLKQSWNLLWTWSKPQIDFKTLIYFQKINHFVNNKQLSRKDLLKKNIEKIKRLGTKIKAVFDIIPDTYLLPGETDTFIQKFNQYKSQKLNIWIMKPIGLSRGRGIRLITDLFQVHYDEPVVLQKYLTHPLLLDGTKFDMRIYVVVTNINPLQAFIYKQGFARLSTQKYSLQDLDNNFVHLTNYSIQKDNVKNTQSIGGPKISLKVLKSRLESKGINWNSIWNQVTEIVLKSLISCMNQIISLPNCFQLFGYDIIIDSNLKCWLLQVNSSPSLQKQFALDELIKQQLTDDIIDLVDPVKFNRIRLKQVLQRRVMETQGRKSYINTKNNSIYQLNQDLYYILDGKPLLKYGQRKQGRNFIRLAPGEQYFKIVKTLQSYKNTKIIKDS